MKVCYLIEFGGEKEMDEMDALELNTIDDALDWIQNSMEDDSQYFDIYINCTIYVQRHNQYNTAIVYIDAETIVTQEMFKSEIYSVETIIESNLSIVSKIIQKYKR